ncbi:Autophagy-related protein [Purpureocillium lavendulum]|uniref:Autophagy-related protein n=1 Tax=Purpureocillium lavendulum TaxID=1247861 RepID=A0AB34FRN6_9HYPO|nr:Autophagy-related protein [Purpureocillium lavendulum]
MAPRSPAARAFHCFSRLPAELRRKIWVEALLAADRPTVYLYTWRWALPALAPEPGSGHGLPGDPSRYATVQERDRLVAAASAPAVAYVNSEARDIAQVWMRSRGMEVRRSTATKRKGGKGYGSEHLGADKVLVRAWDAERDALYVGRDQWDSFVEILFEDMEAAEEHGGELLGPCIRHLVLPAWVAYYSYETLSTLLETMPRIETLSVVWGRTLPKLRQAACETPTGFAAEDRDDDLVPLDMETGILPIAAPHRSGDFWAHVQPGWRIEPLPEKKWEGAALMAVLREDGTVGMARETESVRTLMGELEEGLLSTELPQNVWDDETGELTLAIRAVKAAQF